MEVVELDYGNKKLLNPKKKKILEYLEVQWQSKKKKKKKSINLGNIIKLYV